MSQSGHTPSIPQSSALAETSSAGAGASLSELMSRDPEGLLAQDRAVIVAALRADRVRREEAEHLGQTKPKALKGAPLAEVAPKNVTDLDL